MPDPPHPAPRPPQMAAGRRSLTKRPAEGHPSDVSENKFPRAMSPDTVSADKTDVHHVEKIKPGRVEVRNSSGLASVHNLDEYGRKHGIELIYPSFLKPDGPVAAGAGGSGGAGDSGCPSLVASMAAGLAAAVDVSMADGSAVTWSSVAHSALAVGELSSDPAARTAIATLVWMDGSLKSMTSVVNPAIFSYAGLEAHSSFLAAFAPYFANVVVHIDDRGDVGMAFFERPTGGSHFFRNVIARPKKSMMFMSPDAGGPKGWNLTCAHCDGTVMDSMVSANMKQATLEVPRNAAIESILPPVPRMAMFKDGRFGDATWHATVHDGVLTVLTSKDVTYTWLKPCDSRPKVMALDVLFNMNPEYLASYDMPVMLGSFKDLATGPSSMPLDLLPGVADHDAAMTLFFPCAPLTSRLDAEVMDITMQMHEPGVITLLSEHCANAMTSSLSPPTPVDREKRFGAMRVAPDGAIVGGLRLVVALPTNELDAHGHQMLKPLLAAMIVSPDGLLSERWSITDPIRSPTALSLQMERDSTFIMFGSLTRPNNLPTPGSSSWYVALRHAPNDVVLNTRLSPTHWKQPQWLKPVNYVFSGSVRHIVPDPAGGRALHVDVYDGVFLSFGGLFVGTSGSHPMHMVGVQYAHRWTPPAVTDREAFMSSLRPVYFGPLSFRFNVAEKALQPLSYMHDVVEALHKQMWSAAAPAFLEAIGGVPPMLSAVFVDSMMGPRPGPDGAGAASPFAPVSKLDLAFAYFGYGGGVRDVPFVTKLRERLGSYVMLPVLVGAPEDSYEMQLCAGVESEATQLCATLSRCAIEVSVRPCIWRQLYFGLQDLLTYDAVLPRVAAPEGHVVVVHSMDTALHVLDSISSLKSCRCTCGAAVDHTLIDLSVDACPASHCDCDVSADLTADEVKPAAKMMGMPIEVFKEYAHKIGREMLNPRAPLLGVISFLFKCSTADSAL